jgi:ankyrin repeat protein
VQKGSLDLVRVLIVHGADVLAEDNYGLTRFHWAVQERREDHFQFLVEHITQYNYCQLRRTRHRFRNVSYHRFRDSRAYHVRRYFGR